MCGDWRVHLFVLPLHFCPMFIFLSSQRSHWKSNIKCFCCLSLRICSHKMGKWQKIPHPTNQLKRRESKTSTTLKLTLFPCHLKLLVCNNKAAKTKIHSKFHLAFPPDRYKYLYMHCFKVARIKSIRFTFQVRLAAWTLPLVIWHLCNAPFRVKECKFFGSNFKKIGLFNKTGCEWIGWIRIRAYFREAKTKKWRAQSLTDPFISIFVFVSLEKVLHAFSERPCFAVRLFVTVKCSSVRS